MKLVFAAPLFFLALNASAKTVISGNCQVELYEKTDAETYKRVEVGQIVFADNRSTEKKLTFHSIGGQLVVKNYNGSSELDVSYDEEISGRQDLPLIDSAKEPIRDNKNVQIGTRFSRTFTALFATSFTGKPHRLEVVCAKSYEYK